MTAMRAYLVKWRYTNPAPFSLSTTANSRVARTTINLDSNPWLCMASAAGAVAVANYHVVVGVEQVEGCDSCHIMRPMVNEVREPSSDSLAPWHFRNRSPRKNAESTSAVG